MKNFKRNLITKIFSVLLILLISTLFLAPNQLAAKSCGRALAECSIDAAVVGLFGGVKSGLLYFSGCLIGYGWCLEYYDFV